jgi:ECF transporter S component (folate family)
VAVAMLVALEIIITRFLSLQLLGIRIGFGFIPIVLIAILFGPVFAGIGAAVADFLGVMLFGTAPFFPGFTVTAFLVGLVYGFLLYEQLKTWVRIGIAAFFVTVVLHMGLDTFWLYIILGDGVVAWLPIRITRTLVMLPVQIVCIRFICGELLLKRIEKIKG